MKRGFIILKDNTTFKQRGVTEHIKSNTEDGKKRKKSYSIEAGTSVLTLTHI